MPFTPPLANVQLIRAATDKPWSTDCPPAQLGYYDLSDHHPLKWFINGLKGISYNIQLLPTFVASTRGKAKEDMEKIVSLMVKWLTNPEENYDVLCLQELFDAHATELMETALFKHGYFSTQRLGGTFSPITSGGVRIFVRHGIVVEEQTGYIFKQRVDLFHGGDGLADKGIKHVKLIKNQQTYHVMNVHLQSFYNDPSRVNFVELTLAQLLEIKAYIEQQKARGAIKTSDHILLCGDFNLPKNAQSVDLDNISTRGDAFFKRATLLLGEGYIVIEPVKGELLYSFDSASNSYLSDNKEALHADLDLVFCVDPNPSSKNPSYLQMLVSFIQQHLSHCIQKNTGVLDSQMPPAVIQHIQRLSRATDELIDFCMSRDVCINTINFKPLLDFFKTHSTLDCYQLQSALICILLQRQGLPLAVCESVKKALEAYYLQSEEHRTFLWMKPFVESQLHQLAKGSSLSAEDVTQWLIKIKKKGALDNACVNIEKMIKRLENHATYEPSTLKAAWHLLSSLQQFSRGYFSIQGYNEETWYHLCEKEIHGILQQAQRQSAMLCQIMAHFFTSIGECLNSAQWSNAGKMLYNIHQKSQLAIEATHFSEIEMASLGYHP